MASKLTGFLAAVSLAAAASLPDNWSNAAKIITKDVVILGGGASGAHAAVRLREDFGKSIVVVEKQSRLGGHVATYVDPVSGIPYDFGVNSYTDYTGSREFFGRFNVSLQPPVRVPLTTTFADFTTGKVATGYVGPAPANTTAALQKYYDLCKIYESMILPSYAKFPTAVPEDLAMPFRDFVRKHGLEAAVPRIFQVTGLGMGDMAGASTLYVMQAFGAPITGSFIGKVDSYVPTSRKNQELFDKIAALLGKDVLYSSTVVASKRSGDGVELLVRGAGSGSEPVLIRAKRLLVSFEPTLHNLDHFDLGAAEKQVFSKWDWSTVYVGIVQHPSLPKSFSLTNTPAAAVPSNWVEFPKSSFVGRFDYMGESNFRVLVTGTKELDSCGAQRLVKRAFNQLAAAGTIPDTHGIKLKLAAWSDHGSMHLRVPGRELKTGFIKNLYALQGRSSTFWTGAAWSAQFTTILWEYNNQYVLPALLESL